MTMDNVIDFDVNVIPNPNVGDDLSVRAESQFMQNQRTERKRNIRKDIERGFYQYERLAKKYVSDADPSFTRVLLRELMDEVLIEMEHEAVIDPKIEIHSYLNSTGDLQDTVYSMLDAAIESGQIRNSIDLLKLLKDMKKERVDFVKEIGWRLVDANARGEDADSVLPEGVSVQDMVANAKAAREKRLASGSN